MTDDDARIEAPDLVDALGRTWVYKVGSRGLYVHDQMAWTRDMIERDDIGWPAAELLDNPNYDLCGACRAGAVWGPAEPAITADDEDAQLAEHRLDVIEDRANTPSEVHGETVAGWDTDPYLAHARYLGADAALSSVSWVEMDESDARSILSDIDPQVLDRYPEPTLIDWAVACGETFGMMLDVEHVTEAMADAWHEGRDAVWSNALQATALRVLGEIERALDVERDIERDVASYRSAAGLS